MFPQLHSFMFSHPSTSSHPNQQNSSTEKIPLFQFSTDLSTLSTGIIVYIMWITQTSDHKVSCPQTYSLESLKKKFRKYAKKRGFSILKSNISKTIKKFGCLTKA